MISLKKVRKVLADNVVNAIGWETNRRIIIFESDDWGSIRMPSAEVYRRVLKGGVPLDKCPYNKYDSLASEEDLQSLFEVLNKFRKLNGNLPVFTINCVVANPDFKKIKAADYKEYHYELFTDTLSSYPGCRQSFRLWKEGIASGIIYPQFHGREHLNVNRWMKGLQQGLPETHLAFENGFFGISTNITSESRKSYMAALDFDEASELADQKQIIAEGLKIFEQIFGFRSESFIATNYTWHPDIEQTLFDSGVKFIQGARAQQQPTGNGVVVKKHFMGNVNRLGMVYTLRNAAFEPAINQNKDWVKSCLSEISTAFYWNKPAIISTHRLNYIGSVDAGNRERNLVFLDKLLTEILKKWPEVEFMTSDQLGRLILSGKGEHERNS